MPPLLYGHPPTCMAGPGEVYCFTLATAQGFASQMIVLCQPIVLWLFWQWWLGEGFLLRVPTWKFLQQSTQKISTWKFLQQSTQKISTWKPTLTYSCTLFCDSLVKSWLGLILAYLIICMQHLRERLLVFPKVAKTNSKFWVCSSLVFKVHNFGGVI